ncbi:MAG TPA: c-type cytochrome domain-containing protein, partial [Planctomycetota bacterium]|nr:c-type cytochrome domain-containing protein [Planctomycetota bacterium]
MIRTLTAAILLFPSLAAQDARPRVEVPDRVEFNRDIRPLLYENCIKCHGSDVRSRKGNLRLDTKDGAFGEIEKGRFALVPGDLEKSELWRRISTSEREDLMPPSKSGKKLTRP